MLPVEELARISVNAGFELHKEIGPGLLESVYEALLAAALAQEGIKIDRQKPIEVRHRGLVFAEGFRVDLMLDDRLIIEVKSVDRLAPVHGKQLLTYLRLLDLPLGLLMNFGGATFREGVKRGGQPAHRLRVFASSRESSGSGQDRRRNRLGRPSDPARSSPGPAWVAAFIRPCAARARNDRQFPCRSS